MLIVFFHAEGIIHQKFVPERQKVNAEFHKSVLEQLVRLRNVQYQSNMWFLLHGNEPPHNITVKMFLAKEKKKCYCVSPSPYSPDLAPADYFLLL